MNDARGMSVAWLWLAPLLMILLVMLVQWLPLMGADAVTEAPMSVGMETGTDSGRLAGGVGADGQTRPYSPLEIRGRDIYLREGCSGCHTQWVRLLDADHRRYGNASQAADFVFERPVQWGLRRYGPDLSNIGGKYPSEWHRRHLLAPQAVVAETTMPAYPWLATRRLNYADLPERLRILRRLGMPYSLTLEEQQVNVNHFGALLAERLDIHRAESSLLRQASLQNDDGNAALLTELDALIAYIQVIGSAPPVIAVPATTQR